MRIFALLLSIFAVPLASASDCDVDLTIELERDELEINEWGFANLQKVRAVLTNTGSEPVVLVQPGDGSLDGRRTPALSWWVNGEKHQPNAGGSCGNINPLRPEEILDLDPGQSAKLSNWLPALRLPDPGIYEVELVYENDPTIPISWRVVSIPHDPEALQRMENSTPCGLTSNKARWRVGGSS